MSDPRRAPADDPRAKAVFNALRWWETRQAMSVAVIGVLIDAGYLPTAPARLRPIEAPTGVRYVTIDTEDGPVYRAEP